MHVAQHSLALEGHPYSTTWVLQQDGYPKVGIRDTEINWNVEPSFREGNGNPLQYSRLENPMDGGAW